MTTKNWWAVGLLLCGVTGQAFANCNGVGANEVGNCGFDDDPLAEWTTTSSDSFVRSTSNPRSGPAAAALNAFEQVAGTAWGASITSDCFAFSGGAGYGFGANFVMGATGPGSGVDCQVTIQTYPTVDCSGTVEDSATTGFANGISDSGYVDVTSSFTASGGTNAILILSCQSVFGGDFDVFMDDAFAGPSLTPVDLQSFTIE